MSTDWCFQFPKKSLIIRGDLNLAWTLWTLSIKLQGSFYFSKGSACVRAKFVAIFLALLLLCSLCLCKIEMRSWVSSWGCSFLVFELFWTETLWFTSQWIILFWWLPRSSVSTQTAPVPPRSHYSGTTCCNSLTFSGPHNQTASPMISYSLKAKVLSSGRERQRNRGVFWKTKGHQRSLSIKINIHKRCSNANLGCICQMFQNKIKSHLLLKLVRCFYMGYTLCDH